jgi:hypothetical protein
MRGRKPEIQEKLPLMLVGTGFVVIAICLRAWLCVQQISDALSEPLANQRLLGHVWWRHDPFSLESMGAVLLALACLGMMLRAALRLWKCGSRTNRGLCAVCGYPRPGDASNACAECGLNVEQSAAMQRRDVAFWSVLLSVTILSSVFSGLARALPGTFEVTAQSGQIVAAEFRQNVMASIRRIGVVQVATWRANWLEGSPRMPLPPARVRVAVEIAGPPVDTDAVVVRLDDAGHVVPEDVPLLESLWRRNGAVLPADLQRLTGLVEMEGWTVADRMRRYQGMSFSASTFFPSRGTAVFGACLLLGFGGVVVGLVWLDLRKSRSLGARRAAGSMAAGPAGTP